jgi:5-methylcytosine-specific restriction enzyme A
MGTKVVRPQPSEKALRAALTEFDLHLRDNREWNEWETNRAHKYAIEHGGRRYPVKKIVSIATGIPVKDFSGGRHPGHTNDLVTPFFSIVPLQRSRSDQRNPDWTRDELILALDFYLSHRPSFPGKTSKAIAGLSLLVREVAGRLGIRGDAAFRNENGVYMKLMNFRRLDPAFIALGKKGLRGGNVLELQIWKEFAHRPKHCAEIAAAIKAALEVEGEDRLEDDEEGEEGGVLTRLHKSKERDKRLVRRKKKAALEKHGRLACEACGFDFQDSYGSRGDGFIECHHTRPLHTLTGKIKTKLSELALLCANCHRMIHRRPWCTVQQLRESFR